MIISSYGVCHFTDEEHTLLFYDVHKVPARLHVGWVGPVEPENQPLPTCCFGASSHRSDDDDGGLEEIFDGKDESSCTGFSSAKAAIILGEQGCLNLISDQQKVGEHVTWRAAAEAVPKVWVMWFRCTVKK